MGTRDSIRNPHAYEKRQAERRLSFNKKVAVAKLHMVGVLHRHFDGELKATTQDEAFDQLIAKGSLGAMVSARRIAQVMKRQHQAQYEPRGLSRRERRRRDDAARVIDEAIDQLEAEGKLTITVSNRRTVIVTMELTEPTNPFFAEDVGWLEDPDVDELYDPRKYVRTGRAKVDSRIFE